MNVMDETHGLPNRKRNHGHFDVCAFAPGRVNLIGEHTDYNDGLVCPAAIDRGTTVHARLTSGPSVIESRAFGRVEFDLRSLKPGTSEGLAGWALYPAGVAWALGKHGVLPNIQAEVSSDVPIGAGLSSSASIEMAFALVWNSLAGLSLSAMDMALACQKAENEFVGLRCGIMDQYASAMGRKGHALILDVRSMEPKFVPIPASMSLVVCDTGVPRNLAGSGYNERRSECEAASRTLGASSLRDVKLEDLEKKRGDLGDRLFRRALHVVTENDRVIEFGKAMEEGDLDTVGSLMAESHESLRNNYEVSCIQLDRMVQCVSGVEGCRGSRMTGAGFGGAAIALVDSDHIEGFLVQAENMYRASFPGLEPTFLACVAGPGAHLNPSRPCDGEISHNSGQTISKIMEDVESP